ncbi:MAG: enoyl-CoA hydratase [Pseudomonadota bacterium]
MFSNETGTRLFAAAFSLVLSAAVFATTIIPASPGMFA